MAQILPHAQLNKRHRPHELLLPHLPLPSVVRKLLKQKFARPVRHLLVRVHVTRQDRRKLALRQPFSVTRVPLKHHRLVDLPPGGIGGFIVREDINTCFVDDGGSLGDGDGGGAAATGDNGAPAAGGAQGVMAGGAPLLVLVLGVPF